MTSRVRNRKPNTRRKKKERSKQMYANDTKKHEKKRRRRNAQPSSVAHKTITEKYEIIEIRRTNRMGASCAQQRIDHKNVMFGFV